MDIAAELKNAAPLSEQEVRKFMNRQEQNHEPNVWWQLEGWLITHPGWALGYVVLVAVIGLALSSQTDLGRVIDGIVAVIIFAAVPWVLIGLMGEAPPGWYLTNGEYFPMKAERRKLADLHLRLSRDVSVWVEEQVLRSKHGHKPLAAVLWLVAKDSNEPNRIIRRGIRIWSEIESETSSLQPASY